MDKACTNPDESDIAKAFSELYTRTDTIYWRTAPTGCPCYIASPPNPTDVGFTYISTNSSDAVTKVQQCTDNLEQIFADYGIEFDDIGELTEYLDHFGNIESEFKCSGICTKRVKYYFSDIVSIKKLFGISLYFFLMRKALKLF